jgi:oligopeptide transport system substrate-binding protein
VDLDDETSEISPELATDWTVSLDGKVYTFTLRDDMTWSDGNPVTAEDVRYGILRTLDPATNSSYAYPLAMIIENAADYNRGTITDPDLVGFRIGLCGESPIRVGDHGPRAR